MGRPSRTQRGVALITVLGILALFLLVALIILDMAAQNSKNFGNAYQKQRYYDVAEAGIDRGLHDLDTALPSPGTLGFLSATPAPPPSPPTADQTPLPNESAVPYYYSYWYNAGPTSVATADPFANTSYCGACTTINIPPFGGLIWSHTDTGLRDVGVEAVVSRFAENTSSCAICAAQNVTVTGSDNISAPPVVCGNTSKPFKVCSDPSPSPGPAPSHVPILSGGSYNCSGAEPAPCAFGDGTSTPDPSYVQQSVSSGVVSGFLASQGAIDQLADAAAWQSVANGSTIQYLSCSSGCSETQIAAVAPAAGDVTFINGSVSLSSRTVLSYAGTYIIDGCLNISQPGLQGTTSQATVIVLGTDAACGGTAASIQGGGNTQPPLWNGGTLYAAQGSVSVAGNGSVRGYNFYGAIVAAGSVSISGNGYFAWQSSAAQQALNFGPFAIDAFSQY